MNHELESPLTAMEYNLIQEKLLNLLSRQVERYTGGDSTSIRIELAQELLNAICYCLNISAECPDERWRRLLYCDLSEEYQKGLKSVEQKKQFGKQLWRAVCASLPTVENTSMLDTLKNIGKFWDKYDSIFFAHEIPCDIDYQLAVPVSELYGIDYINQYLENLFCENRFLIEYQTDAIIPILNRYCPDYKGLLINLFEPVVTNALGLAVLEKSDKSLHIGQHDLTCLYNLFEPMNKTDIHGCLLQGVERLSVNHTAFGQREWSYISQYCGQLTVRIDRLRDSTGLEGIFLVT